MATRTRLSLPPRARTLLPVRPGPSPVLIKELRAQMRGGRAFLILTGYLVMLTLVAWLLFSAAERSLLFLPPGGTSASIGQALFAGLTLFILSLLLFLTPALTAGTISGEHEAQTYEMLLATPLRPVAILVGKLIASLSYIFLLLFATLPLMSMVFLFGGVGLRDVAAVMLLLAATALFFALVSTFFSALFGRTGRATVAAYMTLLATIFTPLFSGLIWQLQERRPPLVLTLANPYAAATSLVLPQNGEFPFFLLGSLRIIFIDLLGGGWNPGIFPVQPLWQWTLAFYGLGSLALAMAAVPLLRPPGLRWPGRIEVAGALGLFLLAAALAVALLGGVGELGRIFSDGAQLHDHPPFLP